MSESQSAAALPGRAQASPELEKLIANWRAKKQAIDSYHATMGVGYEVCADELEKLLASADAAVQEPNPWQPIASAPEATWVLVSVPNYGLNIATMTRDPNFLGENGKFWFIRGEDDSCRPTHWMPLPAAPRPQK